MLERDRLATNQSEERAHGLTYNEVTARPSPTPGPTLTLTLTLALALALALTLTKVWDDHEQTYTYTRPVQRLDRPPVLDDAVTSPFMVLGRPTTVRGKIIEVPYDQPLTPTPQPQTQRLQPHITTILGAPEGHVQGALR